MPSASIKSRVEQILGPATQVHAVAAVRLYVSESPAHWEWTRVAGAVALATTNEPGRYLYVVDLNNNSIPLSQELYENFAYDNPRDFFHSFEMDDCVAGLSFADTADAKAFYQAVTSTSAPSPSVPTKSRPSLPPVPKNTPPAIQTNPPPQPPSHAPAPSPPAAPPSPNMGPKTTSAPPASSSAGKKKAGGGIFSKLKSAFASSDVPEDFVVSDPRGFRHESHIGWDPEAGFEIRNIPPEWRKLFQAAGVRKNDLRDAETAQFVMNVIGETMIQQLETARDGGAPPPPTPGGPTSGGPSPPPPPPPPSKAPGGPPPPPGPRAPPPTGPRAPPPQRDARGDLMNSIKQGHELRKVDPSDPKGGLPDLANMNAQDNKNLVDTLAAAMAMRRTAISSHDGDGDEDETEEAWSE